MKRYECEYAVRQGDDIVCTKLNEACGNVHFCRMSGRAELTEFAVNCPVKTKVIKKKGKAKK